MLLEVVQKVGKQGKVVRMVFLQKSILFGKSQIVCVGLVQLFLEGCALCVGLSELCF